MADVRQANVYDSPCFRKFAVTTFRNTKVSISMTNRIKTMKWRSIAFLGVLLSIGGCSLDESPNFQLLTYDYDFKADRHGWEGDFCDYPVIDSSDYSFKFEYADLPSSSGMSEKAWMLSGENKGNGLFMFMKKKIEVPRPETEYTIAYDIEFISSASLSSINGLTPSTSVFLKAGASGNEPKKIVDGKYYRLNIDKGLREASGTEMILIGDISKEGDETNDYKLVTRRSTKSFNAKSNEAGELWLIVGLESTLEGYTSVYFTNVTAVISIN